MCIYFPVVLFSNDRKSTFVKEYERRVSCLSCKQTNVNKRRQIQTESKCNFHVFKRYQKHKVNLNIGKGKLRSLRIVWMNESIYNWILAMSVMRLPNVSQAYNKTFFFPKILLVSLCCFAPVVQYCCLGQRVRILSCADFLLRLFRKEQEKEKKISSCLIGNESRTVNFYVN